MRSLRLGAVAFVAAVFVGLLAALQAYAAATPEREPISDFVLDNGMEVVVIPDHRAPIVTHMVWYKVGSADEPPGKSGIAHFFEHLMFKGTERHPVGEFDQIIAELGGSQNAFTSNDYTAYYQTIPPSALQAMMDMEADRMRNLILTDEVIGPERDVILEERRQRVENNPQALLSEEVAATLYQNHPYGVPVIGWLHEIAKLNRADAVDFYDRYYAPNNAILVVAGDVDAETVRRLAEETYGKVPRGPALPPRVRPQEPEQNTARTVTLSDSRVTVPSFSKTWLVPSYNTAEPGEAEALDLLSAVLGGGSRSRIYKALVVDSGIASSAGAYYNGGPLDVGSFAVYGTPRGDAELKAVEEAIEAEIARIIKDGISEKELEAAKNRFLRSVIFASDNQARMANLYGSTLATGGTVRDVAEWPERIRAVTADQVRDAASRYLSRDNAVTSYLLPTETMQN